MKWIERIKLIYGSFIKEITTNLLLFIIIIVTMIMTGMAESVSHETVLMIIIMSILATLLSIVRIKYQFPKVDFEAEIKTRNIPAGQVISAMIISEAIIVGCGVIALAWLFIR